VTLVPPPIAVADHVVATGVVVPVGSYLAVCDLGAGVEASVLRRGPTGFEVLSTLDDPDAGGARVDELLAAQLSGHQPKVQEVATALAALAALTGEPHALAIPDRGTHGRPPRGDSIHGLTPPPPRADG
jgi:hypothetical protein